MIFLDEIGDLTRASQIKPLRVIQDREYFPLGSDPPRSVLLRIAVAKSRDLSQLANDGEMGRDRDYRLRTHQGNVSHCCAHYV